MSKTRNLAYAGSGANILGRNGIGTIATDTIYGVVASALSKQSVSRAYEILRRNPKKPFIILISSIKDLALFDIKLDNNDKKILTKIWPGKISIILPAASNRFLYLHRGSKTLAFRVPKKPELIKFLKKTGPLISTSANPQGEKPAETIAKAKAYFGDSLDFYIDGGKMKSLPSTLIEIKNGKIDVIRQGAKKIPKI